MNECILHGRIGKDPETINTNNGNKVTKFSFATSEKYKDKEETQWHQIVIFGKQAEIAEKYFKKGQELVIKGKISYRKYEEKYYTDIIMLSFSFCGSGNGANNSTTQSNESDNDEVPY